MSFFEELKQRNVVKVAVLYIVASWLLLQVGDVLFENLEAPAWAFRILLALLALFFLPTLVFAWVFELTPEGLKREKNIDRSHPVDATSGRKINGLIIGLLLLAIATVVADRLWPEDPADSTPGPPAADVTPAAAAPASVAREADLAPTAPAAPPGSIAVLPFANMSGDVENEYFADGLSEEILNFLAGVPDLRVTARTSSFQFKGKNQDVRAIGESLNVANVLEGSVRRSGDRARITAQLIRASDGYHLWSETYDRQLDDVFEVQTEIADNVTRALGVVLDETQRQAMIDAGLRNVEAFIAYQKGRQAFMESHTQAIDMDLLAAATADFTRAVELEPAFAQAYFLRSDYYAHRMTLQELDSAQREAAFVEYQRDLALASEHARTPAQRALIEVDRELVRPSWAAVRGRMEVALDTAGCAQQMWLEVSPVFGFADQQLARAEHIIDCDPLNALSYYDAARAALWAGRHDEALAFAEAGLQRVPDDPTLALTAVNILIAQGRLDEARDRTRALRHWYLDLARINLAVASGEIESARQQVPGILAKATPGLRHMLDINVNAIVGNRAATNAAAARLDTLPSGALMLASITLECLCGAPFDLDATPRFRQRLEEAGVAWPPATILPVAPPLD
jgi:TolB-like protein